jgi:hypothetical protein
MSDKVVGYNFGRGPSKKFHILVWSKLAKWIMRRKSKCKKLMEDGRWMQSDGKSSLEPLALVS